MRRDGNTFELNLKITRQKKVSRSNSYSSRCRERPSSFVLFFLDARKPLFPIKKCSTKSHFWLSDFPRSYVAVRSPPRPLTSRDPGFPRAHPICIHRYCQCSTEYRISNCSDREIMYWNRIGDYYSVSRRRSSADTRVRTIIYIFYTVLGYIFVHSNFYRHLGAILPRLLSCTKKCASVH